MTAVRTIAGELARAAAMLAKAGVDTAQLDAEVLMAHAIGSERVHVISHPGQRLRHEEVHRFRKMLARRVRREPLAYITGGKESWGLSFEVTPAVLIPRPETETLVEVALAQLRGTGVRKGEGEAPAGPGHPTLDTRYPLVADIGVGSGCVAVALAVELQDAVIYSTEASPAAAEVARRNAEKHQVQISVVVLEGDLFAPLPQDLRGRLDAVVSNPPYIPSAEIDSLQPEIALYEPREALDGGPDGMAYHRRILDAAPAWLKPGAWVHLEVGVGQAEAVAVYGRGRGYGAACVTDDLAGIPRVVSCELIADG